MQLTLLFVDVIDQIKVWGAQQGGGKKKVQSLKIQAKKRKPLHAKKPEQAKLSNLAPSDGSIMTKNYKEDTFLYSTLCLC